MLQQEKGMQKKYLMKNLSNQHPNNKKNIQNLLPQNFNHQGHRLTGCNLDKNKKVKENHQLSCHSFYQLNILYLLSWFPHSNPAPTAWTSSCCHPCREMLYLKAVLLQFCGTSKMQIKVSVVLMSSSMSPTHSLSYSAGICPLTACY